MNRVLTRDTICCATWAWAFGTRIDVPSMVWVLMPADFLTQLAAFAWFRFFDAVKPGPVGWAGRGFKGGGWRGGWGILFDDLVAAFCTLLVFALWRSL